MDLMQTLWSMAAGACFFLAVPHAILALSRRDALANLLFSLAAAGAGGVALGELVMMRADSPETFTRTMKLIHLPLVLLISALVWFVVVHLHAKRTGLAGGITVGWIGVLMVNLASPYSIVFGELPRLERVLFPWGETCSLAVGPPHPLKFLPDLLTPVFLVFVADASVSAWRRGARRRALLIGGSILVFIGIAGVHSLLVDLGFMRSPYLISLTFLSVILALGLELTFDAATAAGLSEEIRESEKRWRSLLENVRLLVTGVDDGGRFTYLNPYFCETMGYTREELLGKPADQLVPKEGRDRYNRELVNAIVCGPPSRANDVLLTRAGEERVVSWSVVPMRSAPGDRITGLLSIGADLTEQRRAEGDRDRALEDLKSSLHEIQDLKSRLEDEVFYLQKDVQPRAEFGGILGESDALRYVLGRVEQVAPLETTVLIEGETGVGKGLVAQAIHSRSSRRERSLVTVSCAALPPTLVEAELFGHEAGAFTGANRRRRGRFELADGSTLFLDEVGELPLELQGKLLRVLEDGAFERLGGDQTLRVDVRLIAATNRKLRDEVAKGRFREDLYFRLHVYPVTVPPLRQRQRDIPILVNEFARKFAQTHGKKILKVPQPVLDELTRYEWPGNVRELRNVIERAVITSSDENLRLADTLRVLAPSRAVTEDGYRGPLDEIEKEYILQVLSGCHWRIEGDSGAADRLGLHPNTLRFRMKKLGIKRPIA